MGFKIATWNVNSIRARQGHLHHWVASMQPDLVALQETKIADDQFPLGLLEDLGYRAVVNGQKTYNGVAVFVRQTWPISTYERNLGPVHGQKRFLHVAVGQWHILDVYVPNGESLTSEKFQYKQAWIEALRAYLERLIANEAEVIVLGDFNIAPGARDVYDPAAWGGRVLFSEDERWWFQRLLDIGLHDSYRELNPDGVAYSWWDYRTRAFRGDRGLRIDHILVSRALWPHCRGGTIDRGPRGWERPSDHAPVILEFDRSPST